jgi:hypothetical protein
MKKGNFIDGFLLTVTLVIGLCWLIILYLHQI